MVMMSYVQIAPIIIDIFFSSSSWQTTTNNERASQDPSKKKLRIVALSINLLSNKNKNTFRLDNNTHRLLQERSLPCGERGRGTSGEQRDDNGDEQKSHQTSRGTSATIALVFDFDFAPLHLDSVIAAGRRTATCRWHVCCSFSSFQNEKKTEGGRRKILVFSSKAVFFFLGSLSQKKKRNSERKKKKHSRLFLFFFFITLFLSRFTHSPRLPTNRPKRKNSLSLENVNVSRAWKKTSQKQNKRRIIKCCCCCFYLSCFLSLSC